MIYTGGEQPRCGMSPIQQRSWQDSGICPGFPHHMCVSSKVSFRSRVCQQPAPSDSRLLTS